MKFRYRAGKAAKDKSDVTWPVIADGVFSITEFVPRVARLAGVSTGRPFEIWRK